MTASATLPPLKKLVVVGGTGFLGRHVCRAAVTQGWNVVSISRRGQLDTAAEAEGLEWVKKVHWEKGSVFDSNEMTRHLTGASAVVHTVGQLLEADYKSVISGKKNIVSLVGQVASSFSKKCKGLGPEGIGAENPFKRSTPPPSAVKESDQPSTSKWNADDNTFEKVNRDTALAVANVAASASSLKRFVYISAASGPMLPPRYLSTKREAEQHLIRNYTSFTTAVLRPGFLFSESRQFSRPLAGVMSAVNSVVPNIAGAPPLNVEMVAEAAVKACNVNTVEAGIFEVEAIRAIASTSVNP